MSRHDPRISVQQMLDSAREAVELSRGRARGDLETERVLSLALFRLLEVLGEAASRVPPPVRDRLTEVPWTRIVGLRNRLIHGYDAVDHDAVWDVLSVQLPLLVPTLERMIAEWDG